MPNNQSLSYGEVASTGMGIKSSTFELDHSQFTDVTTTGSKEITLVVPPRSLRLACIVETTETWSAAITVGVGIAAAGTTWTSAAATATAETLGFKAYCPYGAATIITGAFSGSTAESVHVTITCADYTLITSGKVKITVFYLATQNY